MMRQMRDNMKAIMLITAIAFVGLMVFGWEWISRGAAVPPPPVASWAA